jgi:murein DD-endopeptidase MepM/ murein hydrolase activator NlpD
LRRLAALLLLILSACAAPRARQKMSFDELYSKPAPSSVDAGAARASPAGKSGKMPQVRRKSAQLEDAPVSQELRAALATFATQARAARSQMQRGSAMPDAQVLNWREMNATLDAFLRQSARKTSSLDVVRARVTLEAELEEDARTYGDMPADLADAVLARMDQLAVRMAELRLLQLKPSKKKPLQFAWPVDPVVITSVYGSRVHPITGQERDHLGLDLAAKRGQLVTAAARGVVLRAGWNGAHGNQVIVEHEGNVTTRYSHLSRLLVTPGEVLEEGDVVGAAGKTGLATGVHLHFELWRDGQPVDPLDELGPTDSGEEPAFVRREVPAAEATKREGRRPVGRRPR